MITSTHYRSLPDFCDRQLPIRLHQAPSASNVLQSCAWAGAIAVLLIASPAVVYAIFMLGEADFASLTDSAYHVVAISLAVILMASLFAKDIFARIVRHTGCRRIITINATQVTVREETLFGSREWREPLAGYCGVEHQERATANGWQHRLVLSHPQPERQVLVWVGDQVPDVVVAGYQSLLSRSADLHTTP